MSYGICSTAYGLTFNIDGSDCNNSGEIFLGAGTHYVEIRAWSGYGPYKIMLNYSAVEGLNEIEDNNTIENAQSIGFDDTINGLITNEDKDLYKIEVQQYGKLSYSCSSSENSNLVFFFGGVEYYGSGSGERWLLPGTYYIEALPRVGNGKYSFSVNFSSLNEIENNDSPETAQVVQFGHDMVGQLKDGELDYYKFETSETGKVSLYFDFEKTNLYFSIDGNENYSAKDDLWLKAGTHYIKIYSHTRWDNGSYNFKLNFSGASGLDDAESNDNRQNAHEIEFGEDVKGILTVGDSDFYKFETTETGKITLNYTTEKTDLRFYVDSWISLGKSEEEYLAAGTHYLYVTQGRGSGTYSFSLDFSSISGLNEVEDNSWGNAQKIEIGNTIKGVLTDGDADWYTFETTKTGKVSYNFISEKNNSCLYIDGYGVSGSAVGDLWLTEGTHNLQVSRWGGNGLYSFSLDFSSISGLNEVEDNDTRENAQVINSGDYIKGVLTNGDADRFKFVSTEDGIIKFNFINEKNNLRFYVDEKVYLGSYSGEISVQAGVHYIEVFDHSGYGPYEMKINFSPLLTKGSLDNPKENATISGKCSLYGWYLDMSGVSKIDVLIDGIISGNAVYGDPRADVKNAYPAYNNSNSGYHYYLDTTKLTNGMHNIVIREVGNNGKQNSLAVRKVIVANPKGCLDNPKENTTITGVCSLYGWYLDMSGVSKIEVLIDGNVVGNAVGNAVYGDPRADVKNAYPAYNNGNSGYHYYLDTTKLTNGIHTIVIREVGNNGVQNSLPARKVNVSNSKGFLDNPIENTTISGKCSLYGWYLDMNGVSRIEVLIDGIVVGNAIYGDSRTDVKNAYPAYNNSNSGYHYYLDTTKLTNGTHNIVIREVGNNGVQNSLPARTVNVSNNQ